MVPGPTRFVAPVRKKTYRPSAEMAGYALSPFASFPVVSTLTLVVVPLTLR